MPKLVTAGMATISFVVCLAAPVLYFLGYADAATYRTVLLGASIGWFVFATAWAARKKIRSQ